MNLNDRLCPFCNGNKLQRHCFPAHDSKNETVNVIECRTCQAGWQWPLRRSEQQSIIEFENAYAEHNDGTYFDLKTREAVANCQLEFINTKIKKPGRLLDIGCGDGIFARHMANHGWDVVGIDPALTSGVSEDLSPGRLSLQSNSVADLPANQLFDVITLWDVVEHVEKPDELIVQATAYLAPGGILIAETGNYQSAGRINSRGTWWNYQVDHRWYFSPPQLCTLLTQAGLSRIELADKVLRPWWKGHSEMSKPRFISLAKAVAKRPWRIVSTLRSHSDLLAGQKQWAGWGGLEIMTMVGQKVPVPYD